MPRILSVVALLLLALGAWAEQKPVVIQLWSGKPPGVIAAVGDKKDTTDAKSNLVAGKRVIRLGNVSQPTITLYRPAREKDTGVAVVVCPGGAYNILALDLEGSEVCEWLNTLGITGVLLEYRVPRAKTGLYYQPALMDAQRAMRVVRSRASEWGLNPNRIGILGFSAGGHLAATTATNFDKPAYEPIDRRDEVSGRPDFTILVYPAYLTNAKKDALVEEIRVGKDTPPTFLVHAGDDGVPADNSALMYLALKRAGVKAELHIYDRGGHGYGLRRTDKPVTEWPKRCEEWLRQQGLLGK